MFGFGIGDVVGAVNKVRDAFRGDGVNTQQQKDTMIKNHETSEELKDLQHDINGTETLNEFERNYSMNNTRAMTTNTLQSQQNTISMNQNSAQNTYDHISELQNI
ncbi:MAG: hypothetical protein ACXIVD_02240 [Salinarimonas sp.]